MTLFEEGIIPNIEAYGETYTKDDMSPTASGDDWNKKKFGKLDVAHNKNTEPLVSTNRGTVQKDKFSFAITEKP